MKFATAITLTSLCTSINTVETGFGKNKVDSINDTYLEGGEITDLQNLRLCKECFWLGERNIKDTVATAIKDINDGINKQAQEENHGAINDFKVFRAFTTNGFKKTPYQETKAYGCDQSKVCSIKISWNRYDYYHSENAGTTDLSDEENFKPWSYEKQGNLLIITHRFTGNITRKMVYTQLETISTGNLSVSWYAYLKLNYGYKVIDFKKEPITIKSNRLIDDTYEQFFATVFGYIDEPFTQSLSKAYACNPKEKVHLAPL